MRKTDKPSTVAVLLLSLMWAGQPCAAEQSVSNRSPLTSVGAISALELPPDPEDPGIGGGFDHVSYFRNRFIPKLDDCTAQIDAVFRGWVASHDLVIPLHETSPGELLIHATQLGLDGLFELTYRVDTKRERARVTVYFYSPDGVRHAPLAIKEMLERWEISKLQDALDKALACGRM